MLAELFIFRCHLLKFFRASQHPLGRVVRIQSIHVTLGAQTACEYRVLVESRRKRLLTDAQFCIHQVFRFIVVEMLS